MKRAWSVGMPLKKWQIGRRDGRWYLSELTLGHLRRPTTHVQLINSSIHWSMTHVTLDPWPIECFVFLLQTFGIIDLWQKWVHQHCGYFIYSIRMRPDLKFLSGNCLSGQLKQKNSLPFISPVSPPPLRQFGGLDSALLRLLKAGGVNLANSSDKGKCVNSHLGLQLWVSRHIANTGLIVTRAVSAIAELVFFQFSFCFIFVRFPLPFNFFC